MKLKLVFILSLLGLFIHDIHGQESVDFYRTVTVAKGGGSDYETIQAAINSCRDFGPGYVLINIKNGTYHEKVVVPSWKTKINIKGESRDKVVIINDDHYSKKINCSNNQINTFTSYTLQVLGNDIILDNLTIENSSCNKGQAVALHVEGDRFQILNSNIIGCQDSLYAATEKSRQYYYNCLISGTTDFIFGSATVVFENCEIKSLSNSYITAASTTNGKKFGFVFLGCKFIAADNVNSVYLGRPWRPYARTVILYSELGKHIRPEGWNPWKGDKMFRQKEKTAYYAEFENHGPGADLKNRVSWSRHLTQREAKKYTISNIFSLENDHWGALKKFD